ncbi:HAMP domain-containing protein [Moorella sulfitireducens]|uniref:HAMP domain-containing protein n=1 Tax=Neomoorella sulfitireducens TaxID=2972948 RepID=UPI0021AC53D8|nr:HAMP domain-containing protein [Moorella sulfitireducens]
MRNQRFWRLFQAVSDATSVRVKIMGIVLGLVILLGISLTVQMRFSLRAALGEQLEKRGVSIAGDIAARSLDLVLTNNVYALHQLLIDTLKNNEDARYAFIVDPGGNLLAHTFGEGFPRDLLEANSVSGGEKFKIETLDTDEGLIHDIAVPIFDGRAGIARVGMAEHSVKKALASTTWKMLLVTYLVSLLGIAAAYFLTRVLTKPILELVKVAGAVARGDLNQKARVWARDEIGRLSMAFNTMTENLASLYNEKEEFNRQLLRRNQELTTIWEITSAASHSLNLDTVLNDALDKVIERLGLTGEVVLIEDQPD